MRFKQKNGILLVFSSLLINSSLIGCSQEQESVDSARQEQANVVIRKEEPQQPTVIACASDDQKQCQEVLDCTENKGCVTRKIAFDVEACAGVENREKCTNFEERLKSVTMVSDQYNFISAPFTDQEFSVELVSEALRKPWDLAFLPDGSMLITERKDGEIVHIDTTGNKKVVHKLEVLDAGAVGLLGLAVDPNFSENDFVYLNYAYKYYDDVINPNDPNPRRIVNRISRWAFSNGMLEDEVVLLDNIPGSLLHPGSRLEFGPDGKLYATTGDAHIAAMAQDISFLGGKVLRMNTDGSIPEDNPVRNSYVYSRGHRNPEGLAWHPETGDLYVSEHGPVRYDEINRIIPEKNYGWGSYKCDERMDAKEPSGEYTFPVLCFKDWTIAPSGMEFVSDPESPWHGSLFVASLRGKHLHRYVFDGDEVVVDEIFYVVDRQDFQKPGQFVKMNKRLRDVAYWDGSLYILGDSYGMLKLTPKLK